VSTTTIQMPAGPARVERGRVPFRRLVRAELRKSYDTRAGMWLLIAIGLATLAACVLALVFGESDADFSMLSFVGIGSFMQALLLPALGILVVTSEWSQRTGLTTFTLEPSRSRNLSAKVSAVVILGIAAIVVLLAFAAVMTAIADVSRDVGNPWDFGPYLLLQLIAQQLFFLLSGLAIGMILLNSASAIVVSYIAPTAFSILVNVIAFLRDAAPWVDKNTSMQYLLTDQMSGKSWAQVAVASLLWVWVPMLAGAYRVIRSEVK
jgi:ABC-2 type transport system permease protein